MGILQETEMWKADMATTRDLARQFGDHIEMLERELTENQPDRDVWFKRYNAGIEQYEAIRDQATNLLSWIPSADSIGEETFLDHPFFPSYHMVNTFLPRLVYASRILAVSLSLTFEAQTDEHRALASESRYAAKECATAALVELRDARNYSRETISGPWLGEFMRGLARQFEELIAVGKRVEEAVASYKSRPGDPGISVHD